MSTCCQCDPKERVAPDGESEARTWQWMRVAFAGLIAAQSMIFGLAINLSPPEGLARVVLHSVLAGSAILVFALVGSPVVRASWAAARRGRLSFEQLFLAGIIGAFGASLHNTISGTGHVYYEVVAILLAIFTFGRVLGERRRDSALTAADILGKEFSRCERTRCDGTVEEVAVADVEIGDQILVPTGGGIPVDGVVLDGTAFVREASLTGEPFPVVKRPGDPVLAGSHTLDQALKIRASADGQSRLLDSLLTRVRAAQARPSEIQREADRIVEWFLPVVMTVALLTFVGWTVYAGWLVGLFNALAVILVACPCSMGLATPIGIWSAMADLARRGITSNTSDLVDQLAKIDTVVFDKTGTLAEEDLALIDFICCEDEDRASLQAEIASVEAASSHPVARALRFESHLPLARSVEILPGQGVEGQVGSDTIAIGNRSLLDSNALNAAESLIQKFHGPLAGSHPVYITRNGKLAGIAHLKESLRVSASEVIADFARAGLDCHVFTGDPDAGQRIDLPNIQAGLSPDEKATRVRDLVASGRLVLFVGDGVNDAPALAEATASLSLASGSALARESAMGELVGGDLRAIAYAIARSRGAIRIIRRNLLSAAAYNVIGIAMAAAGILNPIVAALLMLVSSATVTWRALRKVEVNDHDLAVLPSAPVLSPQRANPPRPRLVPVILGLGAVAQGIALSILGDFPLGASVMMTALFAIAGATIYWIFTNRTVHDQAAMATQMFSIGGLAMLAGWWADAGFLPIVRDGACLCGCRDSAMGLGVFAKANWMTAGMIFAAIPGYWSRANEAITPSGRVGCWIAGLLGMLVGMEFGSGCMALVPVSNGPIHFLATYAAMLTGMILGMLAGCAAWKKWSSKQ